MAYAVCFLSMQKFHSLPNVFFDCEISALFGKTCFCVVKLFHSPANAFSAHAENFMRCPTENHYGNFI